MADTYQTTPGEDGQHITYCRLCEAVCGMVATVEDGKITRISPDRNHVASKGHICVKGPAIREVAYDEDRVLTPLKRVGGPGEFEPVSWDDAMADIASRLGSIIEEHGPKAFASYMGNPAAFSTLHYAFAFRAFSSLGRGVRFFNATHVDTGARHAASAMVYGDTDCLPVPDLPKCNFLLILGGNPLVSHMSVITVPRVREALDDIAERNGVVVVDPRHTETASRYEHQPIIPDTDAWLLIGMLNHLASTGQLDKDILREKVSGWDQFAEHIQSFTLDECAQKCGVAISNITTLAERFAKADTAAIYGRVGTNRGRFSTLTNVLIDALNVACGNYGTTGGVFLGESPFIPEGKKAHIGPYNQAKSRLGDFPIVSFFEPGGALPDMILMPEADRIRALIVDSGNPALSYPGEEKAAKAFEQLELMVGVDFYINETNKFADYILPAPTFIERDDLAELFVPNNPEPFMQATRAVIPPLGESRHEFDIYNDLMIRLGKPSLSDMMGKRPDDSRNSPVGYMEMIDSKLRQGKYGDQFGKRPDGLSVARLLNEHPHGCRFVDRAPMEPSWSRIAHEDGKLNFSNPLILQDFERLKTENLANEGLPLRLFGRRMLKTLNSWMHNSERLGRSIKPTLLIHPEDANERGVNDGDTVSVKTDHGAVEVIAEVSEDVMKGAVCYPHGFGHKGGWRRANDLGGANINLIASSETKDWEPLTGNVHVDGFAVEVTRISA